MALSGRFARPDNLLRFFAVDEKTGRLGCLNCPCVFGSRKTLREHLRLQHADIYYSEPDPTPEELELNQEDWTYSAFVFPNKTCTAPLSDYEVTIHDLMELTRYAFLHKLIGKMRTMKARVIRDENFEDWAERKWYPEEEEVDDYEPPPKKYKRGELHL